jgi:hypothetical protein
VAVASPSAREATLALRPGAAFWRAGAAPARWAAPDERVLRAVRWRPGQPGVEWAELPIAGQGEARAIRLVMARIDPAKTRLALEWGLEGANARPAWTIARAAGAAVALNAGMFVDALPWGWVVLNGSERLAPGTGPLSSALIGLRDGRLAWVDGDDVSAWRERRDLAFAFQSYPTLLSAGGQVPAALRGPGAIDLDHRDARLAIGLDRDGMLLVVMTRLDTDLPGLDRVPFGLTVPEMAAVMGALGARQAMLLDGGISAQLAVRDSSGTVQQWPGIRKVPLGLVAGRE